MINIPPRVIHSFKNNTDNIVRLLIIIAPDGMEKLFEEVEQKYLIRILQNHLIPLMKKKKVIRN